MPEGRYQKMLKEVLPKSMVVSYNPVLGKILKSAKAGLFLSQLLYWYDKGRDPEWIYKTIHEIKDELGLSRSEQATAIRELIKKGMIEVKLKGIPRRRFFKLNVSTIISQVNASQYKDYPIFDPAAKVSKSQAEEQIVLEAEYVDRLIAGSNKVEHIVGLYWKFKKFKFPSLEAANESMKREVRAAKSLMGYPDAQIRATMIYLDHQSDSNIKFVWTLETVAKSINHVITNYDIETERNGRRGLGVKRRKT